MSTKPVKLVIFFLGTESSPSNKLYVTEFEAQDDLTWLEGNARREEAGQYEVERAVEIQRHLENKFKYVTGVEVV